MQNAIIEKIEKGYVKPTVEEFNVGDLVKVHVRIKEGNKERTQIYEGTVIKKCGRGVGSTFTVRKSSYGIGVERIFLLNSPTVLKVELNKKGKVRRSKLYYLRNLSGKAARVKKDE